MMSIYFVVQSMQYGVADKKIMHWSSSSLFWDLVISRPPCPPVSAAAVDTAEQQTTTEALGVLDERIPVILATRIALSAPPTGTATITLTGRDIESGAVLVIDGRVVGGSGMLQEGNPPPSQH